ncbi:MAG: 16S rRNA (cytosine(1402)-N(4))-methyltransferase [Albidovulum sp.]|nr:16S rRNA (cytosine(1402)-N(4))-methyltransferase [Albidovulum sp.]
MACLPGKEANSPHSPVLLNEFLHAVSPVKGTWLDGTFGGGGYTLALLRRGAEHVFGIDCDPEAEERSNALELGECFTFVQGDFAGFDALEKISHSVPLDGVVFYFLVYYNPVYYKKMTLPTNLSV